MRASVRARVLAAVVGLVLLPGLVARADLVITMGGDINFNKSGQMALPSGVDLGGSIIPFARFTSGIAPLLNGDLNFANIETVVSDSPDLQINPKAYNFETHPNAIRHLRNLGFNLFSLANNHAYDFGVEGLLETRSQFARLSLELGGMVYSGGGLNRAEAARPMIIKKNGHTIAFLAIGIIDSHFRAGPNSAGLLDFRNDADYAYALKMMRQTKADLKILSVHYGTEKQIELDPGQRARYERAITEGGVDLVIGHHPHVVRPIEMINGRLIIYSLGNYLMLGASDIDSRPPGEDYGLFGRVYFGWDAREGRLKAQAMEVVPLKQMNIHPKPAPADVGYERIEVLNELNRNQVGRRAVIFTPRRDGSGVACAQPGTAYTPRAARVCGR